MRMRLVAPITAEGYHLSVRLELQSGPPGDCNRLSINVL